jgi:hypothetical protein
MSESFQAALEKVDFGKYINQIQEELKKAIAEVGPGRNPQEAEAIQERLMTLIRKQSTEMAKEVGFLGNQAVVFMLSTSIISTAWVSFALRRETSDLSKSPEDRLAVMEMFDALELALGSVIRAASNYADRYTGPAVGTAASGEKPEKRGHT